MELNNLLKKRRSIRKYSSKTVSFDKIAEICNSAMFAPCAANIFTTRIIILNEKNKINQISDACLNQDFLKDAPYLLIVCSDTSLLTKSYGNDAKNYLRQQAGAAIENMLLKATELNLASCWVGAFQEEEIKRILKIPEKIQVEAVLPIGNIYSKLIVPDKRRPDLKMITFFESWGEKERKKDKPIIARR